GRRRAEPVVEAAQPGTGWERRRAPRIEPDAARERPGLVPLAEQAELAARGRTPGEAEPHRIDADGGRARILDAHRPGGTIGAAGDAEAQSERTRPGLPAAQRGLAPLAVAEALRRAVRQRAIPDEQAGRLEGPGGRVAQGGRGRTHERASIGRGRMDRDRRQALRTR